MGCICIHTTLCWKPDRIMSLVTTPWWSKDTVAVVTGANKGIGYEMARSLAASGLTVVLTARDASRGQAAVDKLTAEGLESIHFHQLDLSSSESVQALKTWLQNKFGGIDILLNNAGINSGPTGYKVEYENAKLVIGTNYFGTRNVTEALLPLLRASPEGARIVNTTSRLGLYTRLRSETLKETFRDEDKYTKEIIDGLATEYLEDVKAGRFEDAGWGWVEDVQLTAPIYSESKMFVNAYAIGLAKALAKSQPEDHQILVATFCPGLVDTDMFERAQGDGWKPPAGVPVKPVAIGADCGLWLALLPKEELAQRNGKLFGERMEYPFGWENPPL